MKELARKDNFHAALFEIALHHFPACAVILT